MKGPTVSDLDIAVDRRLDAFRPGAAPPFGVLVDRGRRHARRGRAIGAAAAIAVTAAAVPVALSVTDGRDDRLDQAQHAPGQRPAVQLTVHPVLQIAQQDAATGTIVTPADAAAGEFPSGYACRPQPQQADLAAASGPVVVCDKGRNGAAEIYRLAPAVLSAADVAGAVAGPTGTGDDWYLVLTLTAEGAAVWQSLTADAACAPLGSDQRRVAIVIDGHVATPHMSVAPAVQCGAGIVGGKIQVVPLTKDEAEDLAVSLSNDRKTAAVRASPSPVLD